MSVVEVDADTACLAYCTDDQDCEEDRRLTENLTTCTDRNQMDDEDEEREEEGSVSLASSSNSLDSEEEGENEEEEGEEDSMSLATSSEASSSHIQLQHCSEVQIGTRYNYNAPVSNLHEVPKSDTSLALQIRDSTGVHVGNQYIYNQVVHVNRPEFYGVSAQLCIEAVTSSLDQLAVTNSFSATDNIPSGKLKVVPRREWLAQPPMKKGTKLHHPLPLVVILHTATEGGSTQAECVFLVRTMQSYHIESKGWDDIGYSFLVGGDGSVYVGRGWDTQGSFAYGYNNRSIGIAFIGTFINEVPVPKQIAAGLQLIQEGVQLGKLAKDYKVMAHRQLSATESPGLAFYEIIKTWDHWAEKF
ncbi:peptidoglycan-recognition protein LE-like [Periplaneta americana]|uniref:peptidoglycan-recognition protein LE-like n=1 Tax=Periplaneta americana TaxID=6978 RepID=UPI0037E8B313